MILNNNKNNNNERANHKAPPIAPPCRDLQGLAGAHDVWRTRKSELYFSWPITSPFYSTHVDVWMPGKLFNEMGKTLQLMNCMCDLTQFFIFILVNEATFEILAKLLWNK